MVELLEDATKVAALLDLLPNARAKIDVVFAGADALLKVAHIDYYLYRPTFRFYFLDEADLESSLLRALPAVMHELVHYRTAFDKRYRDAADPVLIEEMTAYAAGRCASVWLSRRGGYAMSIRKAALPSREVLLADYRNYGEGHAGRLLADSVIFPAYPEGEEHEVHTRDVQGIMERCSQVVGVGRGVDFDFHDEQPAVDVLQESREKMAAPAL